MSLIMALWADIFITYIALNPAFIFLRQFYPGEQILQVVPSYLPLHRCSHHSMIWQIVALLRWTWMLLFLRYFNTDNRAWWYLLSFSSLPPTFSALFCCNKFVSISFTEIFALSWEIALWRFLKIYSRFNG